MFRLQTTLFSTLLTVSLTAGCGAPTGFDGLEARISSRVARIPGAVVGVFLKDLTDERTFAWNADSTFHAASTMKIPVMIEVFRAWDDGRLTRDARLPLQNRFASIVDGSPYSLDPGDDSDSAMYGRLGTEVPVRDLVERMITRSSNLATNAVIELVGAPQAQATARSLGASTMMVRRGVEDDKAFARGLNNTTTARDLGALLEAIALDRAASPDGTREMLTILERQEYNDEIPAGLPKGTRVAHKTGQITGVLHDAAIVFPPDGRAPFVLVVLTRGIPDQQVARGVIRDIAGYAWEALVGR